MQRDARRAAKNKNTRNVVEHLMRARIAARARGKAERSGAAREPEGSDYGGRGERQKRCCDFRLRQIKEALNARGQRGVQTAPCCEADGCPHCGGGTTPSRAEQQDSPQAGRAGLHDRCPSMKRTTGVGLCDNRVLFMVFFPSPSLRNPLGG